MYTNEFTPPRFFRWLLSLFTSYNEAENYSGDFDEVFYALAESKGLISANSWYRIQVLRSLPGLIRNAFFWNFTMFFNYLKTSFRNIKKHKSYAFINISGLSIGLACVLMLSIYIYSELNYDSYHSKKDRIFRVCVDMSFKNYSGKQSGSNGAIAAALKQNYPEVEESVRLRYNRTSAKYKDKEFTERFYYADASVFKIFSWPILEGKKVNALELPYSIVITKAMATKYFGNENPIGKMITLNESQQYKVIAVMADVPDNSTLHFSGICSFSTLYLDNNMPQNLLNEWTSHNFNTYVLLKAGTNLKSFTAKIKDIYYEYAADKLETNGSTYHVFLQPLKDIYLRPLRESITPITYVYIFSIVTVFILFIACINYMNLATSRSLTRAREVGVRKTFGANRVRLIKQYLTESLLITTIAMAIALTITSSTLPLISTFVQRDLTQRVLDIPYIIAVLIGITFFIAFVAGFYPALILSRFRPVEVIKNKIVSPAGQSNFRRTLVVIQFIISITLIIGTALMVQQLNYLKDKDAGFSKEHIVCISVRDHLVRDSWPVLQQEFKNIPQVINCGVSSRLPGWSAPLNSKIPQGFSENDTQLMREINIDSQFIPTLGFQLVAGRNFSDKYTNDAANSVIINETAAKKFGWVNPIGKTIKTVNTANTEVIEFVDRQVVGVVKDFHLSNMNSEIQPAFIGNDTNYPFEYGKIHAIAIRINPADMSVTLTKMEEVWKKSFPDKSFDYYFLDEDFNEQFISYERSRTILFYFTALAIFIACLGLFGLVSFAAEKRTKEIGIRKTLGSSVLQIVTLLSKELILLVLLANLIAYPIAYFSAQNWLSTFPYRMNISLSTFLLSTVFTFLISLLTILYQAIKAATANPVQALRYE